MSDQNFVYGVFAHKEKAFEVLGKLHEAGFATAELGVLAMRNDYKYVSGRVDDPSARNFTVWGTLGCLGGLWAGISGSPHIPYLPFQIITPLMAAISGGAVMAYFGSFMGVFLNSGKPQHWANVFEGSINEGSVIVLAECSSRSMMRTAMETIEAEEPSELILREKSLSNLQFESVNVAVPERTVPTLSAVA
ncbi:MAG: hypothetical protein K2X81_06225 [Candidatus Obscuribacterales bacterium]|nr:hypothetical protein [Candidatus Obscuribacterales bacterium]